MRFAISLFALAALMLGSTQAEAASCSTFAVIKSHDADAGTAEISYAKGKKRKYFPKPEGSPSDTSKIPGKCTRKVTKATSFVVKASGGRLSITQVRSNFEGKMLNDTDDENWLPTKLAQLIADKTMVVVVIRPGLGKDAPLGITTIYVPITEEELAEIERLENLAEDV